MTGKYRHGIDAKGRLAIPARLREKLGTAFYVTIGLEHSLMVLTETGFDSIVEKMRSLPMAQAQQLRFFFANAQRCEPDKQGRILVPQTLREFAGLEKDVVLTGNLNRVEVWSKEKWSENCNFDDMDSIAESMESIGIVI